MSGSTFVPTRTGAGGPTRSSTWTPSRAARELGLKRADFDLAVHLGRVRTVPDEGGGGRRVERAEIERLRAQEGFPETLRQRVQVLGTAEGSALMDISAGRFTRLARLGLLVPVRFYLNRYRAVVWLYLAEEVRQFAAVEENAHLLEGRTPETLRSQVAAGVDLRARNWRGRHLGFLLRDAEGPWARAGAVAAFLPPAEVAAVVTDPGERVELHRFRPTPPHQGSPGSPTAHLAGELMTAQDPDEIGWLRSDLAHAVREARAHATASRPAPRGAEPEARMPAAHLKSAVRTGTRPTSQPEPTPKGPDSGIEGRCPGRGLRRWLRRRSPRPAAV